MKYKIPEGYEPVEIIESKFACGNLYMKKMMLLKGQFIRSHVHRFDHYSILSAGTARVVVGEENINLRLSGLPYDFTLHTAGDHILIKAKEHHAIEVIEDAVWTCIHVTDTENLDLVDDNLISDDIGG